MQSDKKHRREPIPRMSAQEFAVPWANNVEDLKKAINLSQRYEQISKEAANIKVDKFEKKHFTNVGNFWNNVHGILIKHQKSLQGKK